MFGPDAYSISNLLVQPIDGGEVHIIFLSECISAVFDVPSK